MNPLLPIEQLAVLFLALAAASGWSAWKSSARCAGASRFLVPALRLIALAALAVIAFNPGRWVVQHDDEAREWAVLVDGSGSMATRDTGNETRWAKALKIARSMEQRATDDESVKLYRFDSDLRPAASSKELSSQASDGNATDIIGAGGQVLERSQSSGRRLAGLIVLTDGRQIPPRSAEDFAVKARALRSPVYPVVLGEAVQTHDLAISTRRRQFTAFGGQPLTVQARLAARNLADIRPTVELLDAAGKTVASQQVPVAGAAPVEVKFELQAGAPAYSAYQLRVKPWPDESTLANNVTDFGVLSLTNKIRILLVEGTPYWDSKFIAQLLQKQANVDLTLIYRLAQDKYFSLKTSGNPATHAVLKSFPDDLDTLAQYDLIVVGKGFEYFLNPARAEALKQFVRERGGALLFARGKSYTGQFPEIEPLEPLAWEREWTGEYSWQPTPVGEEAALFNERLPGRDDPVWTKLPRLSHAWQAGRPKAFSQVLAEGVSQFAGHAQRIPVVASQRYGKGLVVVVNSDDLWQWDFFPKFKGAGALYHDFWLQLINWAIVYADFLPGHDWSLRLTDQVVDAQQPVRARLLNRARDAAKRSPRLRLYRGAKLLQELSPAPVPDQAGSWEGIFSVAQPGTVRVELIDGTPDCRPVYETLWVRAPPTEQEDLSPDRKAMEELAAQTEGRTLTEMELAGLIGWRKEPEAAQRSDNGRWASAWDRGPCLLLLLGAFGWEWFLRRRNGLT